MPTGQGDFLLYFHGGMRKASHTQVHDVVTIELSFDQEYRNGPLHEALEWFQSALYQDPSLRRTGELDAQPAKGGPAPFFRIEI